MLRTGEGRRACWAVEDTSVDVDDCLVIYLEGREGGLGVGSVSTSCSSSS